MKYTGVSFLLLASLLMGCQSNQHGGGANGIDGNSALGGNSSAARLQKGSAANFVATAGDRVFFEFDSSTLTHESQATLIRQVEWLLQTKKPRILIEGRCDERGTREYNLGLGERRAHAVRNFLVAHGVPAGSINVVSFGKDKPIEVKGAGAEESKEEFYRQNRVSITVVE